MESEVVGAPKQLTEICYNKLCKDADQDDIALQVHFYEHCHDTLLISNKIHWTKTPDSIALLS